MKNLRIGLLAGLLILLFAAACTDGAAPAENENAAPTDMMGDNDNLGGMEGAPFDAMFIDSMIPHHQTAIDMAQMAVEQAEHEELRQMAQQIIEDQQQENHEMEEMRDAWYPDLPPTEGMMDMDQMMGMEMSQDESVPFDLRFIDAMIPHHQTAIEMAQMALQQAEHEELRQMAQQIIDEQQREIDQLMQWRAAWYPDAPQP